MAEPAAQAKFRVDNYLALDFLDCLKMADLQTITAVITDNMVDF